MKSNTPNPHHEQPAAAATVQTLEHGALMVVATLVVGIALQAGLHPPGGILTVKYFDGERYHAPGTSLLAVANPLAYTRFILTQTVALLGSLTVIALTISGLPLNHRASLWVRRIITLVSITALAIMGYVYFKPFNV